MRRTHDLIVFLAKAGKPFKEIRETVEAAYPGQALGKSQVYRIMKVVKEDGGQKYMRGSDKKNTVRTPDFIDTIRADIEEDRRLTKFPKLKGKLAGTFMDAESFKKNWDGVTSTMTRDEYAQAFQKWVYHHRKCILIDGSYVEKTE